METTADCWRALLDGETLTTERCRTIRLVNGTPVDENGIPCFCQFDSPTAWRIHDITVTYCEALVELCRGKFIRPADSQFYMGFDSAGVFRLEEGTGPPVMMTKDRIEGRWIVKGHE